MNMETEELKLRGRPEGGLLEESMEVQKSRSTDDPVVG